MTKKFEEVLYRVKSKPKLFMDSKTGKVAYGSCIGHIWADNHKTLIVSTDKGRKLVKK